MKICNDLLRSSHSLMMAVFLSGEHEMWVDFHVPRLARRHGHHPNGDDLLGLLQLLDIQVPLVPRSPALVESDRLRAKHLNIPRLLQEFEAYF